MNVRLTPAYEPTRTDTYTGVVRLEVNSTTIRMHWHQVDKVLELKTRDYSRFDIDQDGGDP